VEGMLITRDNKVLLAHDWTEAPPILLRANRLFGRTGVDIDAALVTYEEFQGSFAGLLECFQKLRENACDFGGLER